jgi:hypothetical protein
MPTTKATGVAVSWVGAPIVMPRRYRCWSSNCVTKSLCRHHVWLLGSSVDRYAPMTIPSVIRARLKVAVCWSRETEELISGRGRCPRGGAPRWTSSVGEDRVIGPVWSDRRAGRNQRQDSIWTRSGRSDLSLRRRARAWTFEFLVCLGSIDLRRASWISCDRLRWQRYLKRYLSSLGFEALWLLGTCRSVGSTSVESGTWVHDHKPVR